MAQDPTSPEAIKALLLKESEKRRKATFWLRTFVASMILLLVGFEIYRWAQGKKPDFAPIIPIAILLGGVAVGASPILKHTAKSAAALRDPNVLGTLLELVDSGDQELKNFLDEVIADAAQLVQEGKDIPLTDRQRKCLFRCLDHSNRPETLRAGLVILSAHGIHRDIAGLEALATSGGPALPSNQREPIKTQAKMALGDLRLRLAKERVIREATPVSQPQKESDQQRVQPS
jgi:hypothetical protein